MPARWPAGLLLAALLAGPAPADDALLQQARAANRAAVAAVKTWRGKVALTVVAEPNPGPLAGDFTRAGDQVRGHTVRNGETVDAVQAGKTVRTLTLDPTQPGDIANFAEVHTGPVPLLAGDPWPCGLLAFPADDVRHLILDDWLNSRRVKVKGAERVTHAGRPVVRVTAVKDGDFATEFDLDPAAGHLVRAYRVNNPSPPRRDAPPLPMQSAAEVTEFKEAKPGVFVPVAVKCRGEAAGVADGYDWAATDVTVNDPVPADAWVVKFPPGLRVVDHVKEGVFRTDAAGESGEWARNSDGRPFAFLGRVPAEVAASAPPVAVAGSSGERFWLPGGGLAVGLMVVGAVLLIRRRRRRVTAG